MAGPDKESSLDRALVLKDAAAELSAPARRLFLGRALTLGGLSMLTGCSISSNKSVDSFLKSVSRFNDRIQAGLFDPTRLAPTYPESTITRPFPFNAFYPRSRAPSVAGDTYRLEVSGLVADRHSWSLTELHELPQIISARTPEGMAAARRLFSRLAPQLIEILFGPVRVWRSRFNPSRVSPSRATPSRVTPFRSLSWHAAPVATG